MKQLITALALAVILLLSSGAAHAQGTQVTWVNAGNPGQTCLAITEIDNVLSSGYYFCPNQVDEFTSPDYVLKGSLYLPNITLEDMSITWGNAIPTSHNANGTVNTFDKTGTMGEFGWTCTTTQHYQYVVYYSGWHKLTKIVTLPGGTGSCLKTGN
jgi:hypothetical protein